MAGFDDELKAAMDVRREQALNAVASDRKTKLLTRITPAEKIALMWAPYMKVEGGYVDGITMTNPDTHHEVFRRVTKNPEGPLAKSFADHLTLMQKLMQNINTAEVQLANLIKLNTSATGVLDNAKLLMQKQAVRSSLESNLKALAKVHRDLVSERHRLSKKLVSASQSAPDARVNFAVEYLIHQLNETVARTQATEASLAMTSSEMMQSGITKLLDFNRAPAASNENARIKLDNFVSQLGSLKLTQNEESNPAYLRIIQTTNALRTSFDSELKANAKALSAHEKIFSKAVTKPKPNVLTSKPTAFDVYLDTLFKADKMIALLEKKRDLVKLPAEVVAVSKELEQWRDMRTQLKAAVQKNNNDNSVTFVNEQNPQGTVLQSVRDMSGDFRNNQQINAMLKLLATQIDHPNYKDNNKFPKLFAGNHNKNMPANWNALIEDPKLAIQHLRELQPEKPKSTKAAKSKQKADSYDAGANDAQPAVARPSANQLLKERDQRNQNSLQGTQNNWNTCKAKMAELDVPKAFVNFVQDQFAHHQQDVQTFLMSRNKLNDTKFIEAMNHRAKLLTNITAVFEQPNVTPVIAINAIRGLAKTEFNRTPDSQQAAVFKAQLSTFVKSTQSVKPAAGDPAMAPPPTLAAPPSLPGDGTPVPDPEASPTPMAKAGFFGAYSRPVAPTPKPDASARMDAADLASDSSIRSDSSRSSTSSSSSDSTRSDNDTPPPPLDPPPPQRGPGSRS